MKKKAKRKLTLKRAYYYYSISKMPAKVSYWQKIVNQYIKRAKGNLSKAKKKETIQKYENLLKNFFEYRKERLQKKEQKDKPEFLNITAQVFSSSTDKFLISQKVKKVLIKTKTGKKIMSVDEATQLLDDVSNAIYEYARDTSQDVSPFVVFDITVKRGYTLIDLSNINTNIEFSDLLIKDLKQIKREYRLN